MAYQVAQGIEDNQIDNALHIAFELSLKSWKLGFSDGRLRSPRIVIIDAGYFEPGYCTSASRGRLFRRITAPILSSLFG